MLFDKNFLNYLEGDVVIKFSYNLEDDIKSHNLFSVVEGLGADDIILYGDKEISIERVAEYGGEGMGIGYWAVFKFSHEEQSCLVKFDGWYSSYEGGEYTDVFYVEPKEVVRTKYVKVTN